MSREYRENSTSSSEQLIVADNFPFSRKFLSKFLHFAFSLHLFSRKRLRKATESVRIFSLNVSFAGNPSWFTRNYLVWFTRNYLVWFTRNYSAWFTRNYLVCFTRNYLAWFTRNYLVWFIRKLGLIFLWCWTPWRI